MPEIWKIIIATVSSVIGGGLICGVLYKLFNFIILNYFQGIDKKFELLFKRTEKTENELSKLQGEHKVNHK